MTYLKETLERAILEAIAAAEKDSSRNPTRYSIIAELCAAFSASLLRDLKSSLGKYGDRESETYKKRVGKISEETYRYMRTLEEVFETLTNDSSPKTDIQLGGQVQLTEEGKKHLETLRAQTINPA